MYQNNYRAVEIHIDYFNILVNYSLVKQPAVSGSGGRCLCLPFHQHPQHGMTTVLHLNTFIYQMHCIKYYCKLLIKHLRRSPTNTLSYITNVETFFILPKSVFFGVVLDLYDIARDLWYGIRSWIRNIPIRSFHVTCRHRNGEHRATPAGHRALRSTAVCYKRWWLFTVSSTTIFTHFSTQHCLSLSIVNGKTGQTQVEKIVSFRSIW